VRSGLPPRRRSWTRPCRWCRRGPRSVSWPFYGTADLIAWCQDRNWDDRLRRKGNRVVRNTEGRTTTGQLAKERIFALENVQLTARKATTHIGVIHDPDHAEPWIIAMAATPGYLKTLDYSARWAIEPMFSDFTSRGFGVEDTRSSTRTGSPGSCWLWPWRSTRPFQRGRGTPRPLRHPPKKDGKHQPKKVARSKISFFTRGLRRIARLIFNAVPLPPLWSSQTDGC
jgi:hypothetical protein